MVAQRLALLSDVTASQAGAVPVSAAILGWAYSQSYRLVSVTRDSRGAVVTASVVWPDGATGTLTTDSTASSGAVNSYHVTHVLSGTTITYTQPAVTRDSSGSVTAQPAIVVT